MFWVHSSVTGSCGVDIFIFLKWEVYEKFWVFPQGVWIFKEEFRMAVCTTIFDNLEFQRIKGVNGKQMGYLGPSEKVLFMHESF